MTVRNEEVELMAISQAKRAIKRSARKSRVARAIRARKARRDAERH